MAKVKLNNVRISFCSTLWEAEQFEGTGPFKYSASFLVEKNSANHKALIAAEEEVAKEQWKDKAKAVLSNLRGDSKLRLISDGDTKTYDGYAGMAYIRATRGKDKGRPLILDQKPKKPDGSDNILSAEDGRPYAGCYVNATVELWPQDNKWGKTVRATLLAVQYARDGDAFAAGSKGSADEFEDLSDTGADDLVA